MTEVDRRSIDEANRLYWEGDVSVADIADRLGWSRRALYDAVEPLPIGADCETCGSPLVFLNRSARTSATATCIACTERADETGQHAADSQAANELAHAYAAEARDRRERVYAAGVAGLAGATVGAALTFLLVRRR